MVSTAAQLSLFDTAAVIQPTYKVGDRVKVRKRPIAATYVKKGDVVEIAAVHPINNSIKFWNERSERWEFLHPDEIGSIFDSVNDSVTPAEVAVTELPTPAFGNDDSPTPAEVVVGESIALDDSPTPAEVVVGESIVLDDSPTPAEVVVGESIVLDDSPTPAEVVVGESIVLDDSPTPAEVVVGESIVLNDSPTPAEVGVGESIVLPGDTDYLDPISIYKPRGTARGGKYYRLSYKDGGKVRQVHIRGGNIASPIAQAKVAEVRSLLAAGVSPAQIAAMLRQPAKTV
jgi:hypothetical protein